MDTGAPIHTSYNPLRLTKGRTGPRSACHQRQRQPTARLAPLHQQPQQRRRRRRPPTRPVSGLKSRHERDDEEESADSWDDERQGPAGGPGGSWSEQEAEAAATRRALEQWARVERTLFDEEDQLPVGGPLADECLQWRGQLAHLRIVGGRGAGPVSGPATPKRQPRADDEFGHESYAVNRVGDNLDPGPLYSEESSHVSLNQQSRKRAKEEVLDYIVEFICKELAEIEAEKEAEDLSENLDEFLKITPAPTLTGKNPLVSNKLYYNIDSSDSPTKPDIKVNGNEERDDHIRRNKLGTVFNERIVVSPVPFVITTRESFSTLRQTPFQYLGDNFNREDTSAGGRRDSDPRKSSLTRKTPLVATPQVHRSWNTQAYPTVWPKNIKLTPIDTSRLPSSKRRTSKTADSVPPRRSRNSLSPISHSTRPLSPRSAHNRDDPLDGLEIRGSQIVAQVPRINGKPARTKLIRAKRVEGQ